MEKEFVLVTPAPPSPEEIIKSFGGTPGHAAEVIGSGSPGAIAAGLGIPVPAPAPAPAESAVGGASSSNS